MSEEGYKRMEELELDGAVSLVGALVDGRDGESLMMASRDCLPKPQNIWARDRGRYRYIPRNGGNEK